MMEKRKKKKGKAQKSTEAETDALGSTVTRLGPPRHNASGGKKRKGKGSCSQTRGKRKNHLCRKVTASETDFKVGEVKIPLEKERGEFVWVLLRE